MHWPNVTQMGNVAFNTLHDSFIKKMHKAKVQFFNHRLEHSAIEQPCLRGLKKNLEFWL